MNYLNTDDTFILYSQNVNSSIYVDKSLLIEKISKHINTSSRYICITRPRRFGKSVNAHMLGAYYTKGKDSRALFENLGIAQQVGCEKHRNSHNVIFMDLSRTTDACDDFRTYIMSVITMLKEDLYERYPKTKEKTYISISKLLRDTGDSFIFILDEWDSIFLKKFMTEQDKTDYLLFLKNMLKDQPYVELAYMTGVLRIPNHELMEKFQSVLSRDSMGDVKEIVEQSRVIVEATIRGEAMKQIKDMNYVQKAEEHAAQVLLVGIAYDKSRKKHTCVIEQSSSSQ